MLPIIVLILSSHFLLYFVCPISFNISHFDYSNNIVYEGDATPYLGAIEFENINYISRVGRAIYARRVHLWDSRTGNVSDFMTRFSLTIDNLEPSFYAGGIAFFLAPLGFDQIPNSAGAFLGLFNTTTLDSSKNQIVLVEFDSKSRGKWDPDLLEGHVGINVNSIASVVYTPWNATFHTSDVVDVRISYDASTRNFSVFWTYQKTFTPQEANSISYQIDLRKVLPEWVIVGFSAAKGRYPERHTIRSWEFSSSLSEDIVRKNGKKRKLVLCSTLSVVTSLILGLLYISFRIRRKQKKRQSSLVDKMTLSSINDDLERGVGPKRFSYKDLVSATKNFSDERKLGEGGFGAVYKGYLNDLDMTVAVKKIWRDSSQGQKEYITEVKIISRVRHRNLVQLIGWCHDNGEFMLVYEFMPNGSLDSHLFGKRNSNALPWALRYKISLGLASALLYLHEEWEQCVVHRDIKASNVMLDCCFNVKLGDFGLARIMNHELSLQTTGLAGTFGYLAPEYISTGKASKESDVYSFGVVALEIVTGKKSIDIMEKKCLVEWVWGFYGSGRLLSAVDEKLQLEYNEKEVAHLMKIGLWCAHPDCKMRPSIRQVIQALNFELVVPNLAKSMPVLMFHVPSSSAAVSSTDSSFELLGR